MKKAIIILSTIFILSLLKLPSAVYGYGDGFQKRELTDYLTNVTPDLAAKAKFLPAKDGHGVVLQTSTAVMFKAVPVNEDIKYRLTFLAKQEGLEAIEENPRLSDTIFNCNKLHPYYQVMFYGEDGTIPKGRSPLLAMPFRLIHEYTHIFYPPPGASFMQMIIGIPSKERSIVSLSDLNLSKQADEGAININPKFELGPYNYSGWQRFNEADGAHQLYSTSDHKTVLFTGFTAFSESFPLKAPGTYKLYQKGSNHVRNNGTHLILLDAAGKEIRRITRKLSRNARELKNDFYGPKEDVVYFVLPKGTARAHFWVYNTTLHELRIERVGDENAYEKLNEVFAK